MVCLREDVECCPTTRPVLTNEWDSVVLWRNGSVISQGRTCWPPAVWRGGCVLLIFGNSVPDFAVIPAVCVAI